MNMKTVIPLGLAMVLGLVAAIMVRNAIAHRSAVAPVNSNLVAVVVASRDVDPGHVLTKEDVIVAKVPAEVAPGRVFSDPNQLVGRVTTNQLAKGQTVMETLLASIGSGGGLQAVIPPGMRAVTLQVNEISSVGGMLEPGCRVDIISTMNDPKTKEAMARTILQNVKITAIGRNLTPPHPVEGQPAPPPSNNVTLLLTLKQAQILELACMSGTPSLVLRSFLEHGEQNVESTPLSIVRNDATDGDAANAQAQANITPAAVVTPAPNPLQPTNTFYKPAEDPETPAIPATIRRTVTFIRNGVESQVTFTVPNPAAAQPGSSVDTNDQLAPAVPSR